MTPSPVTLTTKPADPILLTRGVSMGDGLIVVYPDAGLMTVCDMKVFPVEARSLARLMRRIANSAPPVGRNECRRVMRSAPTSEVDEFCIETGDDHAPLYFDDVPLTGDQVDYYAHTLELAADSLSG